MSQSAVYYPMAIVPLAIVIKNNPLQEILSSVLIYVEFLGRGPFVVP